MASPFYSLLSYLLWFFLLLMLFPVSFITPVNTLCHIDERYALLQLKQSFSITEDASSDPWAYPKVASWGLLHRGQNASTSTDCCSWDGVECDRKTGHVIGLDLSSSCLHGSINSSSTLFHLLHLQKLNLGDNDFNHSQIPSQLRLLTSLTYLNISTSKFSGKIPTELAELSDLTSLDLGNNYALQLHSYDIISLAQNLTSLRTLVLSDVNLNLLPTLPNIWANLSSLTHLELARCSLWGLVPTSVGDLTQLTYLDLGENYFSGQIPYSFGKLTKLTSLNLNENNLTGEISSLMNLTHLSQLHLLSNQLTGRIPPWLSNLTQVAYLNLKDNLFHGTIPESIFASLLNLQYLNLRDNNFTGSVNFDIFLSLKHLTYLHLTGNNLSLVNMFSSSNATSPMFTHLGLGNCHLHEFPNLLRHQDRLNYLNLYGNNIQGQIPQWIGDVLGKTLVVLVLGKNYLTGFEQSSMLSSFSSLKFIELHNNRIQGPLPIPPPSTICYNIFNNLVTGEISPWVCSFSSLVALVLSSKKLSGTIPGCLGNFSDSLLVLDLANNSFSGSIPETFSVESILRMIDLSHNKLEGGLPRSLAKCRMLESVDLSENQISDTFPFWLGSLPDLKLLNLRSNRLFGAIQSHKKYSEFPSLRILDLSCNNFTGILPVGFFEKLSSMKAFNVSHLAYMHSSLFADLQSSQHVEKITYDYAYQLILANKGRYMTYTEIPNVMAAIDLSSNGFQGHIPSAMGTLKMINVLNLSNNNLFGSIPSNLEELTRLESLDFSRNMLSGEIPVQLVRLTFLADFNVSHNQLEGPIPQGKQFDTFENSSYVGNLGLCGCPLTRKCGDAEASSPQNTTNLGKKQGKNLRMNVGLMMVLIGYGSGLVVGLVVGHRFTTKKGGWFIKKFGSRQRTRTRRRRRR